MKIALATSEYHRGAGFPRYSTQLATGLARRGHAVTVITRRAEITATDEGIAFTSYRTLDWSMLTQMVSEPYVLTRLLRKAAREFDVVISVGMPCLAPVVLFGTGTHRAWFLATTSSLGGGRYRRTVERLRPFHRVVMFWENRMLRGRHPRLVVVPGERGAREYTELFGWPRERIAEVPLGVELSEFRFSEELRAKTRAQLGVRPEATLMINVANRGRQKGLDVLVEVLKQLECGQPWRFAFAGDGSLSPALREATAGLRREGRVSLLGRVPSVRPLYCAADLLVFPSRFDPWGLAVTEALACGLPVLCSVETGSSVAVVEGRNGRLIDPADPDGIRRILSEILPQLGSFDRERVAESVAWLDHEKIAERLEDRLMRLADSVRFR